LRLRILSALVLAPAALACLFAGAAPFAVLVALAAALMAHEWHTLSTPADAAVLTALSAPVLAVALGAVWRGQFALAAAVVAVGVAALAGRSWANGRSVVWPVLGLVYLSVPAAALVWLRGQPDGAKIVLWVLLVVWAVDIGAYAAGRGIGGPRLAPRISPGKTWAGLAGGVAAAGLVAGAGGALLGLGGDVAALAAAGGVLAVVGQAGDLAESAFKRRFHAKDSGRLIPGHGGLLDRVDGLLAVAPVVALLVWWRLA
jgi:phosphatidate cytidylyltransferase